jgi:hypothetical protein
MGKIQRPSDSVFCTPPSEPFRFYHNNTVWIPDVEICGPSGSGIHRQPPSEHLCNVLLQLNTENPIRCLFHCTFQFDVSTVTYGALFNVY